MSDFDLQYILARVTERGHVRGQADKAEGWARNTEVLSGQWAGESITELLGDLITDLDDDTVPDALSAYEAGYDDGYGHLDQCHDCLEWVDDMAEVAPDFALCFPCAEARAKRDQVER